HITDKEETNLTVVWAIGTYPVEIEDRDMEIVLFVPFNRFERDFNTQSIFKKDEYYSIGEKIIPGNYNDNLRLKYLINSVRPDKSVLFVTEQMEVIQKDLYMYAVETSYVDISTDEKEGYINETTDWEKVLLIEIKRNEHNHKNVNNKTYKHIDSYVVEDIKYNKEYAGESSKLEKNVTNQNKNKEYNHKKVHNTGKRAKMFKNMNSKNDKK
ncbi:1039_t:CDS:2, partial [Diversispora eburnea]